MSNTTIKVHTKVNGKPTYVRVLAEIIGALAVHATVGEDNVWTVTHRKTGRAVYRFIPHRKDARKIATALSEHPGWRGGVRKIQANKALKIAVGAALRQYGIPI